MGTTKKVLDMSNVRIEGLREVFTPEELACVFSALSILLENIVYDEAGKFHPDMESSTASALSKVILSAPEKVRHQLIRDLNEGSRLTFEMTPMPGSVRAH